jgi:hypothetical protein
MKAKKIFLLLTGAVLCISGFAQTDTAKTISKDSVPAAKRPVKIKPYKEVITNKAITKKGLLTVHKVEDKFYFEITDSLLTKQILAVIRAVKVPGGAQLYGGELVSQQTISFSKGPENKIYLRKILLISAADSSNTLFNAVANSYYDPIMAAFPIVAFGEHSTVIDVTDFLKADNSLTSIPAKGFGINKGTFLATGFLPDLSYIESVNTYPDNTEIRAVKTFASGASFTSTVSFDLNTSLLRLPEIPMTKRFFDPRVGYFADKYDVYEDNQQKVDNQTFIVRWRMEPKPEDMEKYKRGELVEPKKPIVYYIDPATPKQWRPYLIQGINDWQKAFEKAGFKNAISAKEWPEGDTTMSLEDSRFSVLRYFAANLKNAYGPNVHDPRSGEILESHIGWYHNVMTLVHDWYMIQCAAVDPAARKMVFDDSLMGQLIRFVSSHEVGHTLGLRHNMGASNATPVDSLRNKKWLDKYGHTSSIMDYARFNYVAQPEDSVGQKNLFPRINDYDEWAIEWGYKYIGEKDVVKDKKINNQWIINKTTNNRRLWFGGEGRNFDARAQSEDLGDDAMKAGMYGLKNLKRTMQHLPEWTKEEGDDYSNLSRMYNQVLNQYYAYMGHVAANVGSIEETLKSVEQPGDVYKPTSKAKQHEAIGFLNKELFETPTWLIENDFYKKIFDPAKWDGIHTVQVRVIWALLNTTNFSRLRNTNLLYGNETYSITDLLNDLQDGIFRELKTGGTIKDLYRCNLQDEYIADLHKILVPTPIMENPGSFRLDVSERTTETGAAVMTALLKIKAQIKSILPSLKDSFSKAHWETMVKRIDEALEGKKSL